MPTTTRFEKARTAGVVFLLIAMQWFMFTKAKVR